MTLQNKRVLITGGAGFIGSSLARQLIRKKADVLIYDNLSSGSLSNLAEIKKEITFIRGDVLDKKHLRTTLKKEQPNFLIHLVADPYVPNSYSNPDYVFNLIVQGTKNTLEAAHTTYVKRTLFVSSAEVYGNYHYLPMDERHPTNPLSIYALAKLTADRYAAIFQQEKKHPLITLRLFNCYGPRETHPYIIPELLFQASRGNVLHVGNDHTRRSFLYVDDASRAMIQILQKRESENQIFNLGGDKSYSIRELAYFIGALFGHSKTKIVKEIHRIRPLDPAILECDARKIQKVIEWEPRFSLKRGLEKTIQWFNRNGQRWPWTLYEKSRIYK